MRNEIRVTVGVFLVAETQVLILRRHRTEETFPGLWEIPGGGLLPGESLQSAAIRETLEETGMPITGDLPPVSAMEYWAEDPSHRVHYIQVNLVAQLPSASRPRIGPEHEEYRWVPIESCGAGMVSDELHAAWSVALPFLRHLPRSGPRNDSSHHH